MTSTAFENPTSGKSGFTAKIKDVAHNIHGIGESMRETLSGGVDTVHPGSKNDTGSATLKGPGELAVGGEDLPLTLDYYKTPAGLSKASEREGLSASGSAISSVVVAGRSRPPLLAGASRFPLPEPRTSRRLPPASLSPATRLAAAHHRPLLSALPMGFCDCLAHGCLCFSGSAACRTALCHLPPPPPLLLFLNVPRC
ncbi:hypothetical protein B0H15DRAFT_952502 [Mycena belliarum]|uniref:Uncharacterized protein n=1 Tax=Mycena belliarum TaxID=1033014 RepID=A0AAD6XJ71_9AGAR|nr:hypothetical protein B0H15DRAFT_952502 [Mycena belliae]